MYIAFLKMARKIRKPNGTISDSCKRNIGIAACFDYDMFFFMACVAKNQTSDFHVLFCSLGFPHLGVQAFYGSGQRISSPKTPEN